MISSLLQKTLSNRYISIIAATISTTACLPLIANAVPVQVADNAAVTFDFRGCVNRGNDTICGGTLRSNSGDQSVNINRNTSLYYSGNSSNNITSITDSNGGTHIANKISVGTAYICDDSCQSSDSIRLVEGVNYKVSILFRNTSLSSNSIPMLEIGGLGFKTRNISLRSTVSESSPQPQRTNTYSNNNSQETDTSDSEHVAAKRVSLTLLAAKKVVSFVNNEQQVVFIPINGKIRQHDIIRYTVLAKSGEKSVTNLALTQPIPRGTTYVRNSLRADYPGRRFFSIDGGKTYSSNPTIGDMPVPASAYTNVRLKIDEILPSFSSMGMTYEVMVK